MPSSKACNQSQMTGEVDFSTLAVSPGGQGVCEIWLTSDQDVRETVSGAVDIAETAETFLQVRQ